MKTGTFNKLAMGVSALAITSVVLGLPQTVADIFSDKDSLYNGTYGTTEQADGRCKLVEVDGKNVSVSNAECSVAATKTPLNKLVTLVGTQNGISAGCVTDILKQDEVKERYPLTKKPEETSTSYRFNVLNEIYAAPDRQYECMDSTIATRTGWEIFEKIEKSGVKLNTNYEKGPSY